jgi:TolB-like protein/class 3 adenylate cyclase/Flp pilus assembly protein TadD
LATGRVERKLAAILAADVAGYSRLMGADEEGTHAALTALRREVTDPKIREHHGRVVKTTGDGLLVEFASVVDAVRCAVELQREIALRNAAIAKERRIEFRIGINIGDIIVDGDDIFGDGVNVAARLEALAEPGGVCVSRVVRDQVRDKVDFGFEDLGEQQVKNIARPVRAYRMSANAVDRTSLAAATPASSTPRRLRRAVIAVGAVVTLAIGIVGWWTWHQGMTPAVAVPAVNTQISTGAANTPAPRLSFVVLPFENPSRDPDQGFFADGITDDLTTDLSRISDSFVIARNTAFTYKGKPVDVKQIGCELGVRYVVEGSVRRSGDQVQVNVQLIDAESGAHLWADRFETDLRDLAQAQSEITGRLAGTLNSHLVTAAGQRLEEEKRLDPDARDLVMRGRALFTWPISTAIRRQALEAFEGALAIDPGSVDARIGIANVLVGNIVNGWSASVQQDEARAEQLLDEALDRNAGSAWAHFVRGILRRAQNRLPEAKIELEEAIQHDRNFSSAINQLGMVLNFLGQPEAAVPIVERAIRLDPQSSSNIEVFYWNLGNCHLLLGHIDEVVDLFRKARAANPRPAYPHLWLAGALGLKGDIDEARASLAEAIRIRPAWDTPTHFLADCSYCGFGNPQYRALNEKTLFLGLRRAGLPET